MDYLQAFLLGIIVTACAGIGVCFIRFWKRTRDRLFLVLAIAFWIFGINWAGLAFLHNEAYPAMYLIRLLGFAFIIAGVVGKNLAVRRGRTG